MRVPTDLPRRPRRVPRGRPAIIITVVVLIILLMSLRGIAGFWTDYLWFSNLGFSDVFTGILSAKITLAVIFSVIAFALVFVNLIVVDRLSPRLTLGPQDEISQRYREAIGPHGGKVRLGVAAAFALVLGLGQSGQWNAWILFRNAQKFHIPDPQFHKDLGYYVFRLPFLQNLVGWAFGAVLVATFVTAVFHYLSGGIRIQTPNPTQRVSPQVKAHLSLLLGVLALIKGAGYYLQQYSLVLSNRGKVKGALYTDVHAQLPAFKLLMFISLIAFVLLIANIFQRGWTLPALGVGLWFLVSITAGAIYPAIVQRYSVKPVENSKEKTYIGRNIAATRDAMQLGHVAPNSFAASTVLTAQDLANNAVTIRNIRLWDPGSLETPIAPATFSQLQAIRGYYQLPNVDLDRYPLGGQLTQTELSVRELNQNGLPGGKSWVNEHHNYTPGLGAALAPANAVTTDGQPQFYLRDVPPNAGPPAPTDTPQLTRPQVYFGEVPTNFSIVGTTQSELDYENKVTGQPVNSHYDGKGGVTLSSFFRKAAFAIRFGDFNVMISGAITSKSKILFIRDVPSRVHKAAPFLKLDADPYAVINNGRLLWVQDAYTSTDRYPYAEDFNFPNRLAPNSGLNTSFNYLRNSVKATVDAYDGTVSYYVFDDTDPILKTYMKAFPKLFKPRSAMPAGLVDHLRYPEDLFRVQTSMWGRYHIQDATAFYQAGDLWDVAQDPGVGAANTTTTAPLGVGSRITPTAKRQDPFYLLMRLPGETKESFLLLQPMVSATAAGATSQQNLTAFLVVKSDATDYGQIEQFTMPSGAPVRGPVQINSLINQDVQVSQAISLLNTNGSEVLLGNVLTIPVEQSLLYVRPLYVSSKERPIPQLKKVIVVYGNQVAYQDTLQQALAQLFPGAPNLTQEANAGAPATPTPTPGGTAAPAPTATIAQLLGQAEDLFNQANAALAKNPPDFATYQKDQQQAQQLIAQAAQQAAAANGPAPATTTTTSPPPRAPTTTGPPAQAA
ncbi:MAG: UPF0182 family membrane protein [Acidimicrobiales bacterium]